LRTIAMTLSNLGFWLYCSSSAVEEFNDWPYVSAKCIFFLTKDKCKLREVFDKFDIQCVINLARYCGISVMDEDYVARRCVHSSAADSFFVRMTFCHQRLGVWMGEKKVFRSLTVVDISKGLRREGSG
jgi:hypothetical protein